jgi:DNA-binding CsgD family transcriptional regulator
MSRRGSRAAGKQDDHPAGCIRVAVVEEVEIFRRGLVACLASDSALSVTAAVSAPPLPDCPEVAVVSGSASAHHSFTCPIVVCMGEGEGPPTPSPGNLVAGVLDRGTMTEAQLHVTVRAAAAGLRVNADASTLDTAADRVDRRLLRVLELLAEGCSTREIADTMNYSERTIKKLIRENEQLLHARSRAQVVAHAIRGGLI